MQSSQPLLGRVTAAALAVLAFSLANHVAAQTLFGWDGIGVVDEFTGPPDPFVCGYPNGPLVSSFPNIAVGCPAVFPIGPPIPGQPGGVAYDSVGDLVYLSDGGLVEVYTAAGVFVDSFFMPAPVFGLGFDSAAGLLWSTDGGALVYAVAPPAIPLCGGLIPFAVLPFPVPFPGPPLSGIDWDPLGGVLWVSDLGGFIQDVLPGGAPGPFGPYPVAPGPCFGPFPPILRVAVDDGSPFGPGHLYVSDGFVIASVLPGGAPAPPTFAFPGAPPGAPCFPNPVPQAGIAYAAHGITYGAPFDPDGLVPPTMGSTGASNTPGPAFTHTITGAVAFAPALLFLNGAFACPPFIVLGVPSYLAPIPTPINIATIGTDAAGNGAAPTPIPPGLPPGTTLFTQWFVAKPFGPSPVQVTEGLSFRIALP